MTLTGLAPGLVRVSVSRRARLAARESLSLTVAPARSLRRATTFLPTAHRDGRRAAGRAGHAYGESLLEDGREALARDGEREHRAGTGGAGATDGRGAAVGTGVADGAGGVRRRGGGVGVGVGVATGGAVAVAVAVAFAWRWPSPSAWGSRSRDQRPRRGAGDVARRVALLGRRPCRPRRAARSRRDQRPSTGATPIRRTTSPPRMTRTTTPGKSPSAVPAAPRDRASAVSASTVRRGAAASAGASAPETSAPTAPVRERASTVTV